MCNTDGVTRVVTVLYMTHGCTQEYTGHLLYTPDIHQGGYIQGYTTRDIHQEGYTLVKSKEKRL